jgi:hypothetical protein
MSYATKYNFYATKLIKPYIIQCVQLVANVIMTHGISIKYWLIKLTMCANLRLSMWTNGHLHYMSL